MLITLQKMLFRSLLPLFLGMMLISILLFELVFFFSQLIRYIGQENISLQQVVTMLALYIPLALSYSVPLSLLFALVFTLSSIYDNNEMTVIHSGGISLLSFGLPVLSFGLLVSLATFFFDNFLLTKVEQNRNRYFQTYFEVDKVGRNEVIVAITKQGQRLYIASDFDSASQELFRLSIVDMKAGKVQRRIDADRASWNAITNSWDLQTARVFTYNEKNELYEEKHDLYAESDLNEPSQSFLTQTQPIEEMSLGVAYEYLQSLRRRKLPYLSIAVSFYQRFSFPFTPLVVSLIGLAMVSRFRQNTLLMSLLTSIGISVLFYIFRLYTGIAGTQGIIAPWLSGWLGVLFFFVVGVALLAKSPS